MHRIAICLSGHFRAFDVPAQRFLTDILPPLQKQGSVDIFISTWDRLFPVKSWHNTSVEHFQTPNTLLDRDRLIEYYHPKRLCIENFDIIKHIFRLKNFEGDINKVRPNMWSEGVMFSTPMFYKIASADSLRQLHEEETGERYSYVIRLRPDLVFENFNPNFINLDKLTILNFHASVQKTSINDFFWAGPSELMGKASALYFNLKELFRRFPYEIYEPEALLAYYFKMCNLPLIICPQKPTIFR